MELTTGRRSLVHGAGLQQLTSTDPRSQQAVVIRLKEAMQWSVVLLTNATRLYSEQLLQLIAGGTTPGL